MSEYSQGVCEDGAAVLKEGAQLTIEEILAALRRSEQQAAEIASAKGAMKVQSDGYMRLKSENEEQAAEIAEIRETSKHINKIRMKEEAELESYKQALEEIKEIAELPPVDGAILRIATKTLEDS